MGVYENKRRETRERIMREFWGLYLERPVGRITVQQVADAAGVHRSTVYFHFHDVYEILEAIEGPLLARVEAIDSALGETTEGLAEVGRALFEEYRESRGHLRVLVTERRDPDFAERYRAALARMMVGLAREPSEGDTATQRAVVRIAASAVAEAFLRCADDEAMTYEGTVRLLQGLMSKGLYATLAGDFGVTGARRPA